VVTIAAWSSLLSKYATVETETMAASGVLRVAIPACDALFIGVAATSVDDYVIAARLSDAAAGGIGDGDSVLERQVNGGILVADSGGDARGAYAVDLQAVRPQVQFVASGEYAFIGTGNENLATNKWATVCGGGSNNAGGEGSSIGGGYLNSNASKKYCTIGGGYNNECNGEWATVGGGQNHVCTGSFSTVAGGVYGVSTNWYSTVGGGNTNTASGEGATVAGGVNNSASAKHSIIGGGSTNTASGERSSIVGGLENSVSSVYGTVIGGRKNTCSGDYGIVGGRRSRSLHTGALVLSDSTEANVDSTAQDQATFRFGGGFKFIIGSVTAEITSTSFVFNGITVPTSSTSTRVSATKTWEDADGNNHSVTVDDGLITAWTVS
jgi:hypothetical protein